VLAHASEKGGTGSHCTAAACRYGTGVEWSVVSWVHGFPAAMTSLIRRAGAVCNVAGLLEEYRLMTITGLGGSGQLVDQVVWQVVGRFADVA
jgi:hypothetical protein